MYGKVMSVPDFAMGKFFRLVTRWTPHEINSIETAIASGSLHPRDAKMKLAREITTIFYSEAEAAEAEKGFVRLFQQKEIPQKIPSYSLQEGQTVLDVLLASGLISSKGEGRRLIDQKGIRLDGKVIEIADAVFPHLGILQVGKRRFIRVVK
ncbi:MAG: hypothetical protein MUP03_05405, partial [Anaerolineales bacterium]|nr:hypothetical protein [Anaerolineales bacterium]